MTLGLMVGVVCPPSDGIFWSSNSPADSSAVGENHVFVRS